MLSMNGPNSFNEADHGEPINDPIPLVVQNKACRNSDSFSRDQKPDKHVIFQANKSLWQLPRFCPPDQIVFPRIYQNDWKQPRH